MGNCKQDAGLFLRAGAPLCPPCWWQPGDIWKSEHLGVLQAWAPALPLANSSLNPLSYLLKRGETSAHRSELLWECGMNENQTPESTSWDSIVNMSGWPPQATISQFMSGKCPWKTTSRAELHDHPGVPGGESIQPEFHDFPWESPWHWKTEFYFLFSPIRFVPVNLWNVSVFPDLMNTFSLSPTTVTGSSQALLWCSAWALYWHQRLPDIEKSLPHLHRSLDLLTFKAQFKTHVLKCTFRDFPGSPVVRNLTCSAGATISIPCQGATIPHALWPKQNLKQKQYCNKFSKDF